MSMLFLAQSLSSEDAAFATPSSPHPHHGTVPPSFSPTAVTPFAAPLHEGFDPAGCGVDAFDFEAAARVLTEGRPDDLVHTTIQIPHALVGLVIGVRGGRHAAARGWAPHSLSARVFVLLNPCVRSVHAIEQASACHLSLDRNRVFVDASTGTPFVLMHVRRKGGGWNDSRSNSLSFSHTVSASTSRRCTVRAAARSPQ